MERLLELAFEIFFHFVLIVPHFLHLENMFDYVKRLTHYDLGECPFCDFTYANIESKLFSINAKMTKSNFQFVTDIILSGN